LAALDRPERFWASDSLRALWPDLTWDLDLACWRIWSLVIGVLSKEGWSDGLEEKNNEI